VVATAQCVDRSFQTEARAKPAHPEVGIASYASVDGKAPFAGRLFRFDFDVLDMRA